jgi:hypothetical protein
VIFGMEIYQIITINSIRNIFYKYTIRNMATMRNLEVMFDKFNL